MFRQIIGFTGRMGAGKSEAAKALHRLGFARTRFAGALKNMLKQLGLTDEHIEGKLKELPCELLGGKSPREAMQTLGTEWGREMVSQSLWIDVWKQTVANTPTYLPICVEDVRFPNEAAALKSVGGILVSISRGSPAASSTTSHAPTHVSELMDFKPDVLLINDGTIEELREKVRMLTVGLVKSLAA